ncbi:protein RSI-1-like [Malania oleifera]|uniref:protein RSI-1-like n=1 Tax=Malania oleifera TaxID=397392 RepID=UPI0025AE71BA|nr:protein RSI-1-like [Malania oleifera]
MAGRPYYNSSSSSSPCLMPLSVVLLLLFLLAFSSFAEGKGQLRPSECKARCGYRCSATSHKKPCMFFCQKCCSKCLCVPAGTYGNKQSCPCYNNWKTKEGGPKCP